MQFSSKNRSSSGNFVQIKTKTWSRDSYGLFDYEAKDIHKSTFQTYQTVSMHRNLTNVFLSKKNENNENNIETLCAIAGVYENFYINNIKSSENEFGPKDLWLVIGHKTYEPKKDYKLKIGEIFKIGRMGFKVLQLKTKSTDFDARSMFSSVKLHYQENVSLQDIKSFQSITSKEEKDSRTQSNCSSCRFCLSETFTPDNPLLNPCNCSGSMKYIHLKCLQTWVNSRLHLDKKNGIVSIVWQGLACELCKKSLPLSIKHGGQTFDILDLTQESKFENFLVLESYNKYLKPAGVHYIDFSDRKAMTLGRSENSDIKLNDISVSRDHAKIIFDKDCFILKDEASKFGTLVLVNSPIKIGNEKMIFQNGRTVLYCSIEKSWLSYFSICPCSINNENGLQKSIESEMRKISVRSKKDLLQGF